MTDFSEKQRQAIAFASSREGIPYERIAHHARVNPKTLSRWRKAVPGFAVALEAARRGTTETEQKPVTIETFIRSKDYLGLGVAG